MPFSASIIERQFAYVPDKILKLGGASLLRPLGGVALTSPFERIRLGALVSVTPVATSASNIVDIMFLMGLTSGMTNPAGAFTTGNFIGASMVGTPATVGASRVLTYNAGSGNPYYACTAGFGMRKCSTLSATPALTAAFTTGLLLPISGFGSLPGGNAFYPRRAIIIIDLTLAPGGTGAVTLTVYFISATATIQTVDMRPDHLFEALDQPGTPSVRGQTVTSQLSSSALNISDLFGALDTFEIFWSNSALPLEISAVGATVTRSLAYASLGPSADDNMQSYAVSSGSITTLLSGGSGWTNSWVGPARDVASFGSFQATSNYAPQTYTDFVGTTFSDDDPFQQYTVGTISYGSNIAAGSFWGGAPLLNSAAGNVAVLVYDVLAGTSVSPYDAFESYATNTSTNGTTASFNGGTFWSSTGTVYSSGTTNQTVTSIPNFIPISATALVGTTYSSYDSFVTYAIGTVDSGVTVNAGSYWSGNGSVTVFNYP